VGPAIVQPMSTRFSRDDLSAFLALLREDRDAREALTRLVRDETLDRLATEVHGLAEAQRGTEERLGALTTRVDQLAAQMGELTARVDQLAAQMGELTARVDQLAARMDQLAARMDQLAAQMGELTARVDQLAAQMGELTARVDQLAAQMGELAQAQRRTEERLESLTAQVQELTAQVGNLRGESVERRYREQAPSYFSGIVRRVRVLQLEQLDRILDEAVAKRAISDEDAEQVRLADLVLVGRSDPEGGPVYLVVEASATIEARDAERAAQRAALLARAGVPTLAVVAGARITVDGEQAARDREVWRVLDGRAYPPGTAVGAA
jgi:chromosome segregation ATPase